MVCSLCGNIRCFFQGYQFDYFGIGTFWACLSRDNDFGVELAFFAFRNTSLVGAAALKVGNNVVTVVSIPDSTGSSSKAPVRYEK